MLKMIASNAKFFWLLFFPLMLIIIVLLGCMILAVLGVPHMIGLAQIIGNGGTLAVLMVAFVYTAFFNSRKRWPGVPFLARVRRVLTFYR